MKPTWLPLGGCSEPVIPVTQSKVTGLTSSRDGCGGFGQSPLRRAISTRAKHVTTRQRRYDAGNAEAAAIILASPAKYEGLAVIWAELWFAQHGLNPKLKGVQRWLPKTTVCGS